MYFIGMKTLNKLLNSKDLILFIFKRGVMVIDIEYYYEKKYQ